MRVEKVNFSLTRTIPLIALTGREEDRYGNYKPFASVTIAFEEGEREMLETGTKKMVEAAFMKAADLCVAEITQFSNDLKEAYTPKKRDKPT